MLEAAGLAILETFEDLVAAATGSPPPTRRVSSSATTSTPARSRWCRWRLAVDRGPVRRQRQHRGHGRCAGDDPPDEEGTACCSPLFTGGSFQGPGYRVAWAYADHPLGPWTLPPDGADVVLATGGDLIGPGHNSVTTDTDGQDVIVFHAWDPDLTARWLHLRRLHVDPATPSVRVGEAVGATPGPSVA